MRIHIAVVAQEVREAQGIAVAGVHIAHLAGEAGVQMHREVQLLGHDHHMAKEAI
jgi:hypothetical protein